VPYTHKVARLALSPLVLLLLILLPMTLIPMVMLLFFFEIVAEFM